MKFKKLTTLLSAITLIMATFLPSITYAVQNNPNAGKGEQGYWCYRTVTPGFEENDESSLYDFYTMVSPTGEESIVYCYNAGQPQPVVDKEQAEKECTFERFGFYDGMANLGTDRGDEAKINTIAAILMAGYPNDGLGKAMDEYAKECFAQVQDRTYSLEDFKREMTQRAIWKADKPRGTYTDGYPYAEALYNYGVTHPLNEETAYADTLTFKTQDGQPIDQTHPLMIDENTLKSELFTIDNYDGVVSIESLGNGLTLIDNETKQETTAIENGRYYYIEAQTKDVDPTQMDMKYMRMANSYFYQYVTSPFPLGMQNMVQAAITHKQMPLAIKMEDTNESTSSSSDNATSETTDSTSAEDTTSSEDTTDSSVNTGEESTTATSSSSDNATSESTDSTSSADTTSSEDTTDSSVNTVEKSTTATSSSSDNATSTDMTNSTTNTGDEKQTEKITFAKVDPNGQFVNGAHLTLKDMTTNKEESFVSTKAVKELTINYNHDYVLTEERAPLGYQLAEPITFRLNRYGFIEVKQNGTYQATTRLCEVLQDEIVNGQHVLDDNTEVTVNLESHIAHTVDCGHIDENGFENEETMTYQQLKDKMNHLQMVDEFATNTQVENNTAYNGNTTQPEKETNNGYYDNENSNHNNGNHSNGNGRTGSLPATGNQKNTMLTVIGVVIVMGGIAFAIFMVRKKHK